MEDRIAEILPEGAYLATRYEDWRNHLVTRRVYYDNGLVEAFDGKDWWTVCEFSPEQIRQAQQAIERSGLPQAKDLNDESIFDTAELIYAWRLEDCTGMVTNSAYPAMDHPAIEKLEAILEKLTGE